MCVDVPSFYGLVFLLLVSAGEHVLAVHWRCEIRIHNLAPSLGHLAPPRPAGLGTISSAHPREIQPFPGPAGPDFGSLGLDLLGASRAPAL